jgi:hypothetical protein
LNLFLFIPFVVYQDSINSGGEKSHKFLARRKTFYLFLHYHYFFFAFIPGNVQCFQLRLNKMSYDQELGIKPLVYASLIPQFEKTFHPTLFAIN